MCSSENYEIIDLSTVDLHHNSRARKIQEKNKERERGRGKNGERETDVDPETNKLQVKKKN